MPAPYRNEAQAVELSQESLTSVGTQVSDHLREAVRQFDEAQKDYVDSIRMNEQKAQLARRQGRWVEAPILDRIVALLTTSENFEQNLHAAGELSSWLPFAAELEGMTQEERTAWLTGLVLDAELDRGVKQTLIETFSPKPGRPSSTRRFAVRAMELHKEDESWTPVANSLPCDWTMVNDPANSIRREVQLLAEVLRKHRVAPVRFEKS